MRLVNFAACDPYIINSGRTGLITVSPDDYTVRLSSALCEYETQDYYDRHFGSVSGKKITLPIEHMPDRDFLAYHRDHVFVA